MPINLSAAIKFFRSNKKEVNLVAGAVTAVGVSTLLLTVIADAVVGDIHKKIVDAAAVPPVTPPPSTLPIEPMLPLRVPDYPEPYDPRLHYDPYVTELTDPRSVPVFQQYDSMSAMEPIPASAQVMPQGAEQVYHDFLTGTHAVYGVVVPLVIFAVLAIVIANKIDTVENIIKERYEDNNSSVFTYNG